MPHGRNPVTAVLVVAAAREAPSALAALHLALLAENERPAGAWHAEWQSWRTLLRLAGGAASGAARLLSRLRPNPDAMAATVARSGGALLAERLVAMLRPELGTEAPAAVREAALSGRLPELLARHRAADPGDYLGAAPGSWSAPWPATERTAKGLVVEPDQDGPAVRREVLGPESVDAARSRRAAQRAAPGGDRRGAPPLRAYRGAPAAHSAFAVARRVLAEESREDNPGSGEPHGPG